MVGKILKLVHESFIDEIDWHTKFFNQDNSINETTLNLFINETLADLINYFSESIIIGEYELKADIEDILIDIEKKNIFNI